jgi:hypothetical protein
MRLVILRMSTQIPKTRLIFKVLIVGRDIGLQTGFLARVSGNSISTHLFNTLGVSLGIARCEEDDEFTIALQLWAIPTDERVAGISKNFTKGHRAVIVVLRPHELSGLHEILNALSLEINSRTIVVVVGNYDEAKEAYLASGCLPNEGFDLIPIDEVSEVITHLSQKLANENQIFEPLQSFFVVDQMHCPVFEPSIQRAQEIECTSDEITNIKEILLDYGMRVDGDVCFVKMHEGVVSVSLGTGSVRLKPDICNFCGRNCKRNANICIISIDSGWSSHGISQKVLLITAKVVALAERCIPSHIEAQLERASICSKFELNTEIDEDEVPIEIFSPHHQQLSRGKSLLEVAEDRMNHGKLPRRAYNILKRRLLALKQPSDNY